MTTKHYDGRIVWMIAAILVGLIIVVLLIRGQRRCDLVHGEYVMGLYRMRCIQ